MKTTKIQEASMSKVNTITVIILIALFSAPVFSQILSKTEVVKADSQKIVRAIANYQRALTSQNNGAAESAIINIMNLKYTYPKHDYSPLVSELKNLEIEGGTKSIRFLSFIVKNYLLYPERYAWIETICCEQDKMFYTVIAERVKEQIER